MYANQLRQLLAALGPDQQIPSDELASLYTPPAGGFVRREDTGETLYTNGQPGGIYDQPADFSTGAGPAPRQQPAMSQPSMAQPAPQSQGQVMRVLGYGNGQVTELSPERSDMPAIDYSRGQIEIPGVGKGYYTKDGRSAIISGGGGPPTKVLLGYDREGSMALNKQDQQRRLMDAQIQETQARAEQVGAPNYQLTPEGDVFNPKTGQIESRGAQSGQLERQRAKAGYDMGLKELQKDEGQIQQAAALEQAYKEWQALNAKVTTGRVAGYMPAIGDADRQRLQQLENYLSMNNFKPGQGSMSNMERSLIRQSGPSVMNDKEANDDIVNVGLGAVQNMKDRANFREAYLQMRGNLLGADQAWQDYLDANPRFTRDEKSGRVVPNENRAEWQAWFSGNAKDSQPKVAAQSRAPTVSGADRARAVFDAKAAVRQGAPREAVRQRLQSMGINPSEAGI